MDSIKSIAASVGWAQKFVRRHELDYVNLHGQGGSSDVAGAAHDIVKLRHGLTDFDKKKIYNVDESGLFFKLLPKRTYGLRTENKKTLRGVKSMKAKDRITAYVYANASGDDKVSLAIIGTAKNPRAFRLGHVRFPASTTRPLGQMELHFVAGSCSCFSRTLGRGLLEMLYLFWITRHRMARAWRILEVKLRYSHCRLM